KYSSDIWFTTVKPEGLSEWRRIETDIDSRLYIGVATDYRKGYIYIPGGRKTPLEDEKSLTGTVFMLRLASSVQADAKTEIASSPALYGPASGDGQLSYIQQTRQENSVFPGFLPYEKARQISQSQFKPLVIYFYTEKARHCQNQAQILRNLKGSKYAGRVILAEVDLEKFPQISQQYGVFRVPTWIFFDSSGVVKFKQEGAVTLESLDAAVRSIAP
ncbi:thioredoxin family protein, partial [Candidatus Sumerlaeota bacterium]|nr:thioredoxin family protein [Candidatus Sumerlaeota bacterium]